MKIIEIKIISSIFYITFINYFKCKIRQTERLLNKYTDTKKNKMIKSSVCRISTQACALNVKIKISVVKYYEWLEHNHGEKFLSYMLFTYWRIYNINSPCYYHS